MGHSKCPDTGTVPILVSDAPTLKEYAWRCLSSVLHKHSTVPLAGKFGCDNAMKKFQYVRLFVIAAALIIIFVSVQGFEPSDRLL
jgi:hypothetical protein